MFLIFLNIGSQNPAIIYIQNTVYLWLEETSAWTVVLYVVSHKSGTTGKTDLFVAVMSDGKG
jgi:hypothetical protein